MRYARHVKSKYGFALLVIIAAMLAGILYFNHTTRETPQAHAQSNVSPGPPSSMAIPDCADTSGQHLNAMASVMSCGTSAPRTALTGTTGSIGGSLLTIGNSTTGNATIAGAVAGTPCIASASDGTNSLALGLLVDCKVTAANTATVTLYAVVALTPASKTYNVTIP